MYDCKQEILSRIPDNNCCSHAFACTLFSAVAQIDERNNRMLVNAKEDVINKLVKIINNFYPNTEISIWDGFLYITGNIHSLLNDCNIGENRHIDLAFFPNECDRLAILKTLFLTCGAFYYNQDNNLNSKGYSLEFVFKREDLLLTAKQILEANGFTLKSILRQNNHVLYTKNSNQICDLLVLLGAVSTSLDVQNTLAIREIRNSTNRQNNCFESNLDKTLNASAEQLEAINYIMDNDLLDTLDENLKEVALARLANPDISLKELQSILDTKISRAGIKYRLDKIITLYKKLKGDA